MKTIYTDKYGIMPWAMLATSAIMLGSAYYGFQEGDGSRLGLGIGSGVLFAILAFKRLWDVRTAKQQGRDPTIVRIKDK